MKSDDRNTIIINKNTKPTPGVPKLVLNNIDRLYLATAVKSVKNLTFIYSLVCRNTGNRQYEMLPVTEIAAFDNKRDAAIYHNTVNQVMAYQQNLPGLKTIREVMADEIARFNENTR